MFYVFLSNQLIQFILNNQWIQFTFTLLTTYKQVAIFISFCPAWIPYIQWRSNGLCRLCNAQRPPAIWGTHQSEGPPAIWGAPAIWWALSNLKDPRQSEGPNQSEESHQSEGPQQSQKHSAIWMALSNLNGPHDLRGPINLRGPQQYEGPQQSEGPPAISGALSNLMSPRQSEGPYQPERSPAISGAPAIWGLSNLRYPQQSDGPQQSEEPSTIEGRTPESCYHFVKLSSNAVNEVNHLQNCSTSRWLLCSVIYIQWGLYCPNVAADVASDCCEIRTIIFKIEDHQKLYKLPCIKTAERPGNVVNRKIFQIAWHLKSSRHFCAWESSQTNILTFRNW